MTGTMNSLSIAEA
jgi:hypothetical protein